MKTINFNLNWNGKLYCNCFTTIRPKNDNKFKLHENYQVCLNGVDMGEVQIVYMKDFPLSKITDAMCLVDIGYLAKYANEVFGDLYPEIEDIGTATFTYIVLERVRKDLKTNNQINENRNSQPVAVPVPGRFCNVCVPMDGHNSRSH